MGARWGGWGVLHAKHLQKPLEGSRADLLRLALYGEVVLQVLERRSGGTESHHGDQEPEGDGQHSVHPVD